MMGAGHYSDRLMWLKRVDGTQEGSGSVPDTYLEQRWIHCRIEEPRGADKIMWGGLQTTVDAIIRIRGNIGVRSGDRMRDSSGGVWILKGCAPDKDGDDQLAPADYLPDGAP